MTRQEFFDHVARDHDPLLFTDDDRAKVARLRARLGDLAGRRVLEPGCGAGPLTECLSAWVGPAGHVFAFDSSAHMAAACHCRLAGRGNVEIACGAVETLALPPGAWDLAILFRVLPHFDDQAAVLRRLRGVLAPGGRLVIANLEGSARLNVFHAGCHAAVRHDRMPDAAGARRLLAAAGCRVVTVVDEDDGFFALGLAERPDVSASSAAGSGP